jgi:phosphatidylglycerol:prolipoprotein diacylglycerol transferase
VFTILVGGFIGAHLVDRFVYFPKETLAEPITIIQFWKGISSFGGFLGATVAVVYFIRKHKLGAEKWRYMDVIVYGFVFGWIFGRLGCFVAFDHPGAQSDFFLAQLHLEAGTVDTFVPRHNLGLYEALYFLLFLAPLFWLVGRKARRNPGFYIGLLCLLYGPIRFAMDYLRIVDVRYMGLTPGQYGSIALSCVGAYFLWKSRALAIAEDELLQARAAEPAKARKKR